MHLKRKLFNHPFERRIESERVLAMRGSRQVLAQVVLFHFWGRGHPQDDAIPNFFPDSKSSLQGLSNEILFVS